MPLNDHLYASRLPYAVPHPTFKRGLRFIVLVHLQVSLHVQRQHVILSCLKTLSVGPAEVWTRDLPHGSPVLYQLSVKVRWISLKIREQQLILFSS